MVQAYGTHNKWAKPYFGKIYKAEPKGYIPEMDDDAGTMSAWYVWAAMGLYPVCVGLPEYQLSTPLFDKISIRLSNGKTIHIECKNRRSGNYYIQYLKHNGEKKSGLSITHEQLIQGGTLAFYLGDSPAK